MSEGLLKSVSTTDKDKKRIEYNVEEISNGWLLCQYTTWTDAKGNYQSENIKTFYEENPLDESAILTAKVKRAMGSDEKESY